MKKMALVLGGMLALSAGAFGRAQVPKGAPAGTNGICKDGTYSTAAEKSGACRGHKGVQTWYAAGPAAMPAPTGAEKSEAMPVPTPAAGVRSEPAPTAASSAQGAAPSAAAGRKLSPAQVAAAKTAAPGGGPGLVWVNTASNVYHCNGTTFYGKTKAGEYMSEADAKAKGAHGERGTTCEGK